MLYDKDGRPVPEPPILPQEHHLFYIVKDYRRMFIEYHRMKKDNERLRKSNSKLGEENERLKHKVIQLLDTAQII